MIFVAQTSDGTTVRYRDTKRHLWLLSLIVPLVPAGFALVVAGTGNPVWAFAPLVTLYLLVPIADMLIGVDRNNPPEEVVEALSSDSYYRALLFGAVGTYWLNFIITFAVLGTVSMPVWAMLALTVSAGVIAGSGLTVAHELGHKQAMADRIGARLAAAISGYGHFIIEHNRGHHVMVATPEDHASARLGEGFWSFAAREIPHVLRHGWRLERERLARKGVRFWSLQNELLQIYALNIAVTAFLVGTFGWFMLPLMLLHNLVGWLHLSLANYVEHYGLKRRRKDNGRYEPCQPHHSWNTNHIVSNLLLFHLQRHSDHHTNPARPYQSLRNFDDLPHLPSGYPGSFLLAIVPPVWRAVMDRKVWAWAGGDVDACNVATGREARYRTQFQAWSAGKPSAVSSVSSNGVPS